MSELRRLSRTDLEAEACTALPAKEVISLLDLNVNIDLALDLAAPIDLAVAANLNVVAPIDAALAANVLSFDSTAQALGQQEVVLDQYLSGEAIANAPQDATIDQSAGTGGGEAEMAAFSLVEPVGDAVGDVTGALPVDGVTGALPVDGVTDVVDGVTGELPVDGVTDVVDGVTGELPVDGVTDVVDGVVGEVPGVVDGVTGELPGVVDDVTDTVDGVVGELPGVVDGVTGELPGVVDDVTDTVDGVVGQLPDVLGPVTEGLLADGLLNVNVDIDLDANLAAPVAGAVSANANIAAPIDAAVAANVLSFDSQATAVSSQTAIITQTLDDVTAEATAAQNATITQ